MKQLEWLVKTYYLIMEIDDQEKRDRKLEQLMSQMKELYQIPQKPSSRWIKQNKAVIALYYRISLSIWSISHNRLLTFKPYHPLTAETFSAVFDTYGVQPANNIQVVPFNENKAKEDVIGR